MRMKKRKRVYLYGGFGYRYTSSGGVWVYYRFGRPRGLRAKAKPIFLPCLLLPHGSALTGLGFIFLINRRFTNMPSFLSSLNVSERIIFCFVI